MFKTTGLEVWAAWIHLLGPLLTGSVTLGTLFNLSAPQFLYLESVHNGTYFIGFGEY